MEKRRWGRMYGGGEIYIRKLIRRREAVFELRLITKWYYDKKGSVLKGSLCFSWKSGHGGRGDILWVWDCSWIGWKDLIVSVNCSTVHSITGGEPPLNHQLYSRYFPMYSLVPYEKNWNFIADLHKIILLLTYIYICLDSFMLKGCIRRYSLKGW